MRKIRPKNTGGRPPKFAEPSHPITVTLPDRVLHLLKSVDPDRAKAITKLVDSALDHQAGTTRGLVEIVRLATGKSIILVAHSEYLAKIPWLRLVEVAPARNIISLFPGTPIEMLEVAINDMLENISASEPVERELMESLLSKLRKSRRSNKTSKEEILLVEIEH